MLFKISRVIVLLTLVLISLVINENHALNDGDDYNPIVSCETTQGLLRIEIYEDWSPLGAKRFLDLVKDDFYTDIALFRCVKKFLVQFGITEDPTKKHWHRETILDDPNLHKGVKKNYLSFAGGGPNTRSTQLFIAFEDLDFLGKEPWETPFGLVIEGQSTLDAVYKGYGDIPPFGKGPNQQKIHNQGNQYIRTEFPNIDFIKSCELEESKRDSEEESERLMQESVRLEEYDPISIKQLTKDHYIQKKEKQLLRVGKPRMSPELNDEKYRKIEQESGANSNRPLLIFLAVLFNVLFVVYMYILSKSSAPASATKSH
jgi:peptidyl-prolyl cis-trans isomerase A (cyclophilin A)